MDAFELSCTACDFATTIETNIDAVLDTVEEHEQRYEDSPRDHFVNFEQLTD